jgi:hypothetical protein
VKRCSQCASKSSNHLRISPNAALVFGSMAPRDFYSRVKWWWEKMKSRAWKVKIPGVWGIQDDSWKKKTSMNSGAPARSRHRLESLFFYQVQLGHTQPTYINLDTHNPHIYVCVRTHREKRLGGTRACTLNFLKKI